MGHVEHMLKRRLVVTSAMHGRNRAVWSALENVNSPPCILYNIKLIYGEVGLKEKT